MPQILVSRVSVTHECPSRRHELPTDDWRYEDRKERARVEEEERRGAANAVSHNEFLYI
jgi:E3 ubiquitin-protein ligase AIP2